MQGERCGEKIAEERNDKQINLSFWISRYMMEMRRKEREEKREKRETGKEDGEGRREDYLSCEGGRK